MPLSVTCECGSKLEIDEKFLGKEILCPDCQRPLPTKAPATPPPLDLPDYRRVSGFAVLSLTLALVGAFTIVGTIAAIVVGIYALKHISDKSSKLDGVNFARAGIALGAFFTMLTLSLMISPYVLGIDGFLREMAMAGRIQYPSGNTVETNRSFDENIVLTRQSNNWAAYVSATLPGDHFKQDDLIMVSVNDDAFVACQTVILDGDENDEAKEKKVLERLYKSELIHLLGRLNGRPLDREAEIVKRQVVDNKQELIVDLRLGGGVINGIDRRMVLQYSSTNRDKLNVLIGAARRNRFDRMNEVFHKTFDSQKPK